VLGVAAEEVPGQLDGAEGRLAQVGYCGPAAGQVQVSEVPGRAPATAGQRERDGTRRLR
jgi:hypothetical protein